MKHDKPILIVGAGSIGRRHLRNLISLGQDNLLLLRSGNSTLPESEIAFVRQETDLDRALVHRPVATIICNPTSLHMSTALAAARAGSHLLIEKPISHNLEGIEELEQLVKRNKLVAQTGFQFRFHPALQRIKQEVDAGKIGKVVRVEAVWGEYLPDWHPWEDYRQSYSARSDLGGGVIATLCHPFDYLRWLLGEVASVSATASRLALGLEVEDTAEIELKFKSGVEGKVNLDFVQKPTKHKLKLVGTEGVINYDFERAKFERNEMFLAEMREFLRCIIGNNDPSCTLYDGMAAVKIILAAKESARLTKTIQIR